MQSISLPIQPRTETITHAALLAIVIAQPGAAIVGIEALTDARARKTGNPHFPISKHVRAVGFVGADYERAVQREGARQGATEAADFVAEKLPWGEWVPGAFGKVISHKGELYLRTQTTPGQRQRQAARLLAYRDGAGRFLARDDARPFLPVVAASQRQAAAGLSPEASEQIMVRTYKFSSLLKVRIGGRTFKVVAD